MPTSKQTRNHGNSAHALNSPHGQGHGLISTDDDALMLEALRIARSTIETEADKCAVILPGSPMIERLRMFAERMEDLHERMSA